MIFQLAISFRVLMKQLEGIVPSKMWGFKSDEAAGALK